ncbi:SchA/CurD-like domain-containing protein, partial [Actinoalloteichus spitiensis]|uniref:SchA/CurD-like domain-containing protein n=1 Tax=Actinoalloteichus spitiensis TaxID=252394 RepID=UPI00036F6D76
MPYAAILFRAQPGTESEIARLVDGVEEQEPRSSLTDPETGAAAEFRGTAPYVRDDVVRVIDHEGDPSVVVDHFARRPGAHHVEESTAPFLVERRDTASPEEFHLHFANV